MRTAVCLFIAMAALKAVAGDCPTPPKLTCSQLQEKIAQRCPKETETAKTPVVAAVPCTHQPCPPPQVTVNCPECKPVVQEKYTVIEKEAARHGNWFAGGGGVFSRGWGLQAGGGYRFSSGWMLAVRANWIPSDGASGMTTCPEVADLYGGSHGGGCRCTPMPWQSDAGSPWGGGFTLDYNF